MYTEVKLCVKHMNSNSEFFDSNLGLLQGEITSSIMFSLFLNDIELHLHCNLNSGITVEQLSIYILLFADDAVILSETAEGLQSSLDTLQMYCEKWKLTVSILKKCCFSQRWSFFPPDYRCS